MTEANDKIDPSECCVEPIITTNAEDTLEGVLLNAKLADTTSPDKGIILLWADEKRVIAHYDLLKRLFEGVFTPPPGVAPQAQ